VNIKTPPMMPLWLRSASARAALALSLSSAALGCATSHTTRSLADGVTVHTFRRDYTNAHVVSNGRDFFMVDSGLEANAPALERDLRASGFDPSRMRAIVLSHGHADHAGGAAYFRRRFGTRVIAGRGDEAMLRSGHNERLCPTNDDARARFASDQGATFTPIAPDVTVDAERSLLDVTGIPARVMPLPGHTEGSLVVTVGDGVFVGDLLRGDAIWPTAEVHFYMCDLEDNRRDVQTVLDQVPRAAQWFPGHFGPLSRDAVRARFSRAR
jgi:glyoxylase-like metal-dependent hydrolase (beta-lactamase superfamily II)